MEKYKFDTLAVHAGYEPSEHNQAMCPPIYQTSAYDFGSTRHAAELFELKADGDIYSRLTNPTVTLFEKRAAAMDGGKAAVAFASGHAAIFSTVCTLCVQGDEIVASSQIYGGTVNMYAVTLKNLGINASFVDCDDLDAWEKAITPRTKFLYFETVGNPNANVADISAICDIAHRHGIPAVVDATFSTPYLCRPIEFGADIVIHSATKQLGGHGSTMGGVVIDSGNFDFAAGGKFSMLSQPDPSYHGIVYTQAFPDAPFAARLRTQILRDLGGCMPAMSAWLLIQGCETLPVRMERHCRNAEKVAAWLEKHPKIEKVNYPGLESSPYHALAQKYMPLGCGSIFTCTLKGGREAGARFMDSLVLLRNVANVGDLRSMVIHPASTTHSQMSAQQLKAACIDEGAVRVSVGLEDCYDIIADLESALAKI